MQTVRDRDALLVRYADNNTQDISEEDLRDFVVSVDIYGEIYAGANLTQVIPDTGATLVLDTNGLAYGITPDQANNALVAVHPGVYDIVFQGTADVQKDTMFEFFLRVNNLDERPLGHVEVKDDNKPMSFALGALIELDAADVVTIFCLPDANNKDFDIRGGARLKMERRMTPPS